MKKYILFILLIPFMGCTEDPSIDTTVMPEETTIGANTFGCLIDGWLYVGGRYSDYYVWGSEIRKQESILFKYDEETNLVIANIKVTPNNYISFVIEDLKEGSLVPMTNIHFAYEPLDDCEVFITRFDKDEKIISGRFTGERIEHGRFDVRYKDKENEAPE